MSFNSAIGDGDDVVNEERSPSPSTRWRSAASASTAPGEGVVYAGNTHPKARMPGQMCVEIANGDAKGYYGRRMAKLAYNLGQWGRSTPHYWKAMLVKVRGVAVSVADVGMHSNRVPVSGFFTRQKAEDAVDIAMRTHHIDCEARNCSVMKGLLELVRRGRVEQGYTLRDYILYVRTLVRRWAPEVPGAPHSLMCPLPGGLT